MSMNRAIAERIADVINRKVFSQIRNIESELSEVRKELDLWKETGVKSAISAVMELKAKEIAREVVSRLYADLSTKEGSIRSIDELKELGYVILEKLDTLSKGKPPSLPPDLMKKLQDLSNGLSNLNNTLRHLKTTIDEKLSDFEKQLSSIKLPEVGDLKAVVEGLSAGVNDLLKQIKVMNRLLKEFDERLETIEQLLEYVHEVSGKLDEKIKEWVGGEEE